MDNVKRGIESERYLTSLQKKYDIVNVLRTSWSSEMNQTYLNIYGLFDVLKRHLLIILNFN